MALVKQKFEGRCGNCGHQIKTTIKHEKPQASATVSCVKCLHRVALVVKK